MPIVKVNRRVGRGADENRAVLDGVHAALIEAFKIPAHDRHQVLVEHDAAHFEIQTDRSAAFTMIEVIAFPGRSVDAKRALFKAIVRNLDAVGVSPADVFVVILEPPLENWSPRNGASSLDVKPSFKLDV